MLTPKQIRIFEAFLRRPYKEITYREIKEYSKEKSNSIIQNAILKFLAEDLVRKRKIGNLILYSINLENSTIFSLFYIIIKENISNQVKRSLKLVRDEIKNIEFISMAIFGSYAEWKQKEKSDLDIAIFVNSLEDKKNCELAVKSAELKSILPLDIHVITKEEMLLMLKDQQENLGKQIAYKHLAVQNPMIFYSIIQEGINNVFKIIYS